MIETHLINNFERTIHFDIPLRIPFCSFRASYVEDEYRTKDGEGYFGFRFVDMGDHWEIDILSTPDYKMFNSNLNDDLHSTHRLPSNRGGFRICFADPYDCKSLQDCYNFAAGWAEYTWHFIRTGEGF